MCSVTKICIGGRVGWGLFGCKRSFSLKQVYHLHIWPLVSSLTNINLKELEENIYFVQKHHV